MKAQHYTLPSTADHLVNGKPGQYVYDGERPGCIIGFVDYVDARDVCFMLFEPKDISDLPDAEVIAETLDDAVVEKRLTDILSETDDMQLRLRWMELLRQTANTH